MTISWCVTTRVENKQIFNTQTSNLWGPGGFLRVKFCQINIFRLFAPSKPPRGSGAGCCGSPMPKISLTGWIMIAMLAGVLLGLWVHYNGTPAQIDAFSNYIGVLTDIFLRMIKMIIAPLVFSTLVVGIAKLGDIR